MTNSLDHADEMSRRTLMRGVVSSLAILLAGIPDANGVETASPENLASATAFLKLSKSVTSHGDIDPGTAARIFVAFQRADPETAGKFSALAALVRDDRDAAALMNAAREQNLEGAASALVAAWYTGTIGAGAKVETVSYRDALMYAPVADGMFPPTYAFGGPAWWIEDPPPAGVSNPVEKPAPAPPVIGNPMVAEPPAKPPQ